MKGPQLRPSDEARDDDADVSESLPDQPLHGGHLTALAAPATAGLRRPPHRPRLATCVVSVDVQRVQGVGASPTPRSRAAPRRFHGGSLGAVPLLASWGPRRAVRWRGLGGRLSLPVPFAGGHHGEVQRCRPRAGHGGVQRFGDGEFQRVHPVPQPGEVVPVPGADLARLPPCPLTSDVPLSAPGCPSPRSLDLAWAFAEG